MSELNADDLGSLDPQPQKSDNKKWIYIAIIILLLLGNGVLFYMNSNKATEIHEKTILIKEAQNQNAALIHQLDSAKIEIQARIDEVVKLGGDTAELGQKLRQLSGLVASLQSQTSKAKADANRARQELADLKIMLREKDAEIEKLKEEREHLFKENTGLKNTVVAKDSTITELDKKKRELDELVTKAAVLKAENIKVVAINKSGKEKVDPKHPEEEFKAKKIDKLKITFRFVDNKVAKIEEKQVLLRVLGPDGAAIYNEANGGGSFKVDGKDLYYSASQKIFFDNKEQEQTFVWSKGNQFASGPHTVEVYCEGHLVGSHTFKVK